jgi:hypothetical protein
MLIYLCSVNIFSFPCYPSSESLVNNNLFPTWLHEQSIHLNQRFNSSESVCTIVMVQWKTISFNPKQTFLNFALMNEHNVNILFDVVIYLCDVNVFSFPNYASCENLVINNLRPKWRYERTIYVGQFNNWCQFVFSKMMRE